MKARAETRKRVSVQDARKVHGPREIPIEWTGKITLIEQVHGAAQVSRDFARDLLMGMGTSSELNARANNAGSPKGRRKSGRGHSMRDAGSGNAGTDAAGAAGAAAGVSSLDARGVVCLLRGDCLM